MGSLRWRTAAVPPIRARAAPYGQRLPLTTGSGATPRAALVPVSRPAKAGGPEGAERSGKEASWSFGSLNIFDECGHQFLVIPNTFVNPHSRFRENDEALFQ